jgi:hypothetical protein
VVYGGRHVSALVAGLSLPLEISAGRLAVGGQVFEGEGYAIFTVVPAGPDRPELVLYAGTGTPGIDGINAGAAVGRGDAPIAIADDFGVLVRGSWRAGAAGLEAVLGPPARRIAWRETAREVAGVRVSFRVAEIAPPADEPAVLEACAKGIAKAVSALGAAGPLAMTVYLHHDTASKKQLTGDAGNGHAIGFARALHVVALPGIEPLVAHEATHLLAAQSWGAAGSALFGEGLAVWVSGQYGGRALADWPAYLKGAGVKPVTVGELLGKPFRALPEAQAYPVAGLLVAAAVAKLGLPAVRDHLFGATVASWPDACRRAGTTPEAMEALLAGALSP